LKKAGFGILSLFYAFHFGCDISKLLKETHKRGVILYGTKYGSTEETSLWMAEGINTSVEVLNIEKVEFKKIRDEYDFYILGSGIWKDGVHKDLKQFLTSEGSYIDDKVIATFVVCGTKEHDELSRERIKGYLNQINKYLQNPPILSKNFGGRLIVEKLTPEDREALIKFYRTYLHKELESWNYMVKDKTVSFGKEINKYVVLS